MKQRVYDCDPVPFSLPWEQYKSGKRSYTYFIDKDNIKGHADLKELFDILNTNPEKLTFQSRIGPLDYFPTKKFKLKIDSAQIIKTGTVDLKHADEILDEMLWTMPGSGITKAQLMVLDLIQNNNWERPIYFAITTGSSAYIGLQEHFQMEGMTYRLVPIKVNRSDKQIGMEYTDGMYDNLMNKYEFGNMNDPKVYLDETNTRMTMNLRSNFSRLSSALIAEGKLDSARQVLDRIMIELPDEIIPYDYFVLPIAEAYFETGNPEKGTEIFDRMVDIFEEQLEYYFLFNGKYANKYDPDKQQNLHLLNQIRQIARKNGKVELTNKASDVFEKYYDQYTKK